jgi:hypothetical protein
LCSTATEEEPTHFVLYLNDATFTGEDGAVLADVVRSVHQAKLPILMLHERVPDKGGCEFELFFRTTPPDLISGGLYAAIAIALFETDHRPVGLTLAGKALGARADSKMGLKAPPLGTATHAIGKRVVASPVARLGSRKQQNSSANLESRPSAQEVGGNGDGGSGACTASALRADATPLTAVVPPPPPIDRSEPVPPPRRIIAAQDAPTTRLRGAATMAAAAKSCVPSHLARLPVPARLPPRAPPQIGGPSRAAGKPATSILRDTETGRAKWAHLPVQNV